jgi:tight adherence protein B
LIDQAFFPALGATVLLGGALAWVLRIERRRARIERQLRAVAREKPNAEEPAISLRRPRPHYRALPAALSAWLDRAFAAAGNRIGPLHLGATGIASAAAVWSMALFAGFRPAFAVALCGGAAAGAPALLLRFVQSRYQRQFLERFPDALDLIVRAVRAGLPLPEAINVVTRQTRPPVSTEFRRIIDEVRIGAEMEEALQRAAARIRAPDFHFFMVSLLVQRQTGGGIAETLSSLAAIIRQRRALHQKSRALSAEAQTSAAIIAAMPVVGGTGLFLINHELMRTLVVDPRGRFMLGVAMFSALSGIIAMKALIKRNLR